MDIFSTTVLNLNERNKELNSMLKIINSDNITINSYLGNYIEFFVLSTDTKCNPLLPIHNLFVTKSIPRQPPIMFHLSSDFQRHEIPFTKKTDRSQFMSSPSGKSCIVNFEPCVSRQSVTNTISIVLLPVVQ